MCCGECVMMCSGDGSEGVTNSVDASFHDFFSEISCKDVRHRFVGVATHTLTILTHLHTHTHTHTHAHTHTLERANINTHTTLTSTIPAVDFLTASTMTSASDDSAYKTAALLNHLHTKLQYFNTVP